MKIIRKESFKTVTMNKKEILKSTIRVLKRNKMRTFFMVLGIIIGIASLSLTFTIGKAFQKQMSNRVKKLMGSNDILITAQELKMDIGLNNDLVSTLTVDDLKALATEVAGISMFDPVQVLSNQEVIAQNRNISTSVRGSSVNGQFVWNRGVTKGKYFDNGEELSSSR